jgi:exosortase/archaeosortase family protein
VSAVVVDSTVAVDSTATAPQALAVEPQTPWARLGLALTAWVGGMGLSLRSLLAEFDYQSPIGELMVVPVLATALVVVAVLRHRHAWAGRLGHGDLLMAGALLLSAAGFIAYGQYGDENLYWLTRPDMLALPLALAGFLVLMLGMRALAVCAFGVFFSFLAWPYPLTLVGHHVIEPMTKATFVGGAWIAERLGAAQVINSGEHVLRIPAAAGSFEVAVASACSGMSSMVGYALVAAAALYMVEGRLRNKAAWLLAGLAVVWLFAVLRIALLAVSGRLLGESFTMGFLHSSASMVLGAVVFSGAVLALGRFGLAWRAWAPNIATSLPPGHYVVPVPRRRLLAARSAMVVGAAGVLFSMQSSVASASFSGDLMGNVPGSVLTQQTLVTAGVDASWQQQFTWAKQYFGDTSDWNRYKMATAQASIWVDSIVVDDAQAFRVHGIDTCYNFHGATTLSKQRVTLDGLLSAENLVVQRDDGSIWHSVHWQWPVLEDGKLRYERVVLLSSTARAEGRLAELSGDPDANLSATLIQNANRVIRDNIRPQTGTSV